jgi:hypothetical protein
MDNTGIGASFFGASALVPNRNLLATSHYAFADGVFAIYDASTFEPKGAWGGMGDFVGDISFLRGGRYAIVGSSGNAAWLDGRVSVVDLDTLAFSQQIFVPGANNLCSDDANSIFVASGVSGDACAPLGLSHYEFNPDRPLRRVKTFSLGGAGRSVSTVGAPAYDAVIRTLFKSTTGL